MTLSSVDYFQLKKYFNGVDSIRWACQNHLRGVSFQDLLRNPQNQIAHHKIIMKGESTLFSTKLPRENVLIEDLKTKRVSIKMGEGQYPANKVWDSLVDKIPTWIKSKHYIINLHSDVGEKSLQAGSFVTKHIQETLKEGNQKFKMKISTGAEMDYLFKDFNDSDSSISKIADVDLLVIFSYNSLSSSDWNKARLNALFEECQIKNTVVILTSKSEQKLQGFNILNIPFADTNTNENSLLKDLGL